MHERGVEGRGGGGRGGREQLVRGCGQGGLVLGRKKDQKSLQE